MIGLDIKRVLLAALVRLVVSGLAWGIGKVEGLLEQCKLYEKQTLTMTEAVIFENAGLRPPEQ
jgi:hypothetical protein